MYLKCIPKDIFVLLHTSKRGENLLKIKYMIFRGLYFAYCSLHETVLYEY